MKKFRIKKGGCLYRTLIGLGILIFSIVIIVLALQDTLNTYGVSLEKFQRYMQLLNTGVSESTVVPPQNKFSGADYASFKTKADEAGFDVFTPQNSININKGFIALNQTLTITDKELGSFLVRALESSNSVGEAFNILSVKISAAAEVNRFNFVTVAKIELGSSKQQAGGDLMQLPNTIYLTNTTNCGTAGNRITVFSHTTKINNLEEEDNNGILAFLKTASEQTNANFDINNLINPVLFDLICEIAVKAGATIGLGNENFSFIK